MYESRVLNELASEGTSRNLCRAYVLAVMTLDVKSVSTECLKNMGCLFLLIKRKGSEELTKVMPRKTWSPSAGGGQIYVDKDSFFLLCLSF